MKEFRCEKCGKRFDSGEAKSQHRKDAHEGKPVANGSERHSPVKYAVSVLILIVLAYGVFYLAAPGTGTYVNKQAKNFTLQSADGKTVSLSDFAGKSNVLLFFSEGLGCDPCWQQLSDIEKNIGEFNGLETKVLTVVIDPPGPTAQEARRWNISLPILIDSDKEVSNSYDALKYSMHPGQRPGHTFVLVDKNGTVKWRLDWSSGAMYEPVDSIVSELKTRIA